MMAIQIASRTPAYVGLTYERYRQLPEIILPYDIIAGDLYTSPAPISMHQVYLKRILRLLEDYIESRELGIILFAPVDVLIRRSPLQTRQPDLLLLSVARTGIESEEELEQMPVIDVVPDLVVEILSSDEKRRHLSGKLTDYADIGIPEVWLASQEAETFEVLRLENSEFVRLGLYGRGNVVESGVLPDLKLPVDAIFGQRHKRRS